MKVLVICLFVVFGFTGCMTVSDEAMISRNDAALAAVGAKSIAVMPVVTGANTSMATDTVAPIRASIHSKIDMVVSQKLPQAKIYSVNETSARLNKSNGIERLNKLFSAYDSTGIVDSRVAKSIASSVGSKYILVSRLNAKKMDILISKGVGTSLESTLINGANGQVLWAGTGDWKKGGMFFLGDAEPAVVAENLLQKTFNSLK